MRHICVCVLAYRPSATRWQMCLDSILGQAGNKSHQHLIWLGDDKEDPSFEAVFARKDVACIGSDRRTYGLPNLMMGTGLAQDLWGRDTIIVPMGADDAFTTDNALTLIQEKYEAGAWMTYHAVEKQPGGQALYDKPLVYNDISRGKCRDARFASLSYSYDARLLSKIRRQDLEIQGRPVDHSQDCYLLFPFLDMCQDAHYLSSEVLAYHEHGGADVRAAHIAEPIYGWHRAHDFPKEWEYQCFMQWRARHLPRYSGLKDLEDVPTVAAESDTDFGMVFVKPQLVLERKIVLAKEGE